MEIAKLLTLTLKPDHGEIAGAIVFLAEELKIFNSLRGTESPFNFFHFRLALDEALLNAIEHGCRQTHDQPLLIHARFSNKILELSVEDPGHGFRYEDVKIDQGRNLENIMNRGVKKAKGWGLAIIQSVCHGLFWNTRGNRITMLFVR